MPIQGRVVHEEGGEQKFDPLWPGQGWTLVTFPEDGEKQLIGFDCDTNDNGGVIHIVHQKLEDDFFRTKFNMKLPMERDGTMIFEGISIHPGHIGTLVLEHSCYLAAN